MELIIGAGRSAAAPAAGDMIKETGADRFVTDVIEASRQVPVLVAFVVPHDPGCRQLIAQLEKHARDLRGAVRVVTVDAEKDGPLAAQLRIQAVPTVYVFKDGRPLDAFTGAMPDAQLRSFLQRLTAGSAAQSLPEMTETANQLLAQGHAQEAAQLFQEILAEDPNHGPAVAGLLRCLIAVGDTQTAQDMLAGLPPDLAGHADVAAVRTALELARQGEQAAGGMADLHRRLAQDENDHQARYDLAMAHFAGGDGQAAVDELLELFRRDRAWNDEAARKQLLKLFEALGNGDPITMQGRRRLSSLFFS